MRRMLSLLTAAAAVACSDSSGPFIPTIQNVAGSYELQTLIVTSVGTPVDWVARGATLTISLDTNGTTTGELHIPGGGLGGADFTADMAGSWTLTGGTVRFSQIADTFIRDMDFLARRNSLSGTDPIGSTGLTVRAVLTK